MLIYFYTEKNADYKKHYEETAGCLNKITEQSTINKEERRNLKRKSTDDGTRYNNVFFQSYPVDVTHVANSDECSRIVVNSDECSRMLRMFS